VSGKTTKTLHKLFVSKRKEFEVSFKRSRFLAMAASGHNETKFFFAGVEARREKARRGVEKQKIKYCNI
jgi:hypothetical protein